MARLSSLFFALIGYLLIAVGAVPTPDSDSVIGVTAGDVINALGLGLVTHINVTLTAATLTNNLVSINFDVQNPLFVELSLDRVQSSAGLNGTIFASFDHSFSRPLVVPPFGTRNSGNIDNVLLIQGVDASLAIIPFGVLDLSDTNVNVRAGSIAGLLGLPVPVDGLTQSSVPTQYTISVT